MGIGGGEVYVPTVVYGVQLGSPEINRARRAWRRPPESFAREIALLELQERGSKDQVDAVAGGEGQIDGAMDTEDEERVWSVKVKQ